MAGNPNPSPETRFKPGSTPNPGGKTSAHRKAEVEAAEIAAQIQLDLVRALAKAVTTAQDGELEYLTKEVNALLKNAQDRGFGAPKQEIDQKNTGEIKFVTVYEERGG